MKTAMILAAGRGERLKPITDTRPKALCLVNNKPLIQYHVERLAEAGFERVIINHAYLGGQIRAYLGNGSAWGLSIYYSPEPPGGLETAGGIVNALPLLGDTPFVTVNADIMTDYNFASLALPQNSLAHVVLIQKPSYYQQGDFNLSAAGELENTPKIYTFSGIACYHPTFFNGATLGRYSVTPMLRSCAERKQATAEVYGGEWLDIGSPVRLMLANASKVC
jgi:MurNAc alpha-1-phosphate uridylyltransferase